MHRDYDSIPAIRSSALNCFIDSGPTVYDATYGPNAIIGHSPTDAMQLGTLEHLLILEPDREDEVAVWSGGRRYGKAWDEFQAAHDGKLIVTQDQWDKAKAMAQSVYDHPQAAEFVTAKDRAVEQTWLFRYCGLLCKVRTDLFAMGACVDLKTCADVNPNRDKWMSKLGCRRNRNGDWYLSDFSLTYLRQMWFYRLAMRAKGLEPSFVHIAISSTPPHIVWCHEISGILIDQVHQQCHEAMVDLARRTTSNDWFEEDQLGLGPALETGVTAIYQGDS